MVDQIGYVSVIKPWSPASYIVWGKGQGKARQGGEINYEPRRLPLKILVA